MQVDGGSLLAIIGGVVVAAGAVLTLVEAAELAGKAVGSLVGGIQYGEWINPLED